MRQCKQTGGCLRILKNTSDNNYTVLLNTFSTVIQAIRSHVAEELRHDALTNSTSRAEKVFFCLLNIYIVFNNMAASVAS